MNRESYINEVTKRLTRIFSASKEGHTPADIDRHRLEGFMQAGVVLGVMTSQEMFTLRDDIHIKIFGKSYEKRKAELAQKGLSEQIDYSRYDEPAYSRRGK